MGYGKYASPHWEARIGLLRRAAQSRTNAAFFMPALSPFYGWAGQGAARLAGALPVDQPDRSTRPDWSRCWWFLRELRALIMSKKSRRWYVPDGAPCCVDDLNFTSRDPQGRLNWWDVTPPKTDYWHAHQMLGRAYAFDLLDLLHNKRAEPIPPHAFGYIACAIARRGFAMPDGLYSGFFAAISEYLVTGEVDR